MNTIIRCGLVPLTLLVIFGCNEMPGLEACYQVSEELRHCDGSSENSAEQYCEINATCIPAGDVDRQEIEQCLGDIEDHCETIGSDHPDDGWYWLRQRSEPCLPVLRDMCDPPNTL